MNVQRGEENLLIVNVYRMPYYIIYDSSSHPDSNDYHKGLTI